MLGSRVLGRLARAGVVAGAALVCVATSPPNASYPRARVDVSLRSPDGAPVTITLRVTTEGHPRRLEGTLRAATEHDVYGQSEVGPAMTCTLTSESGDSASVLDPNSYYDVVLQWLDGVCLGVSPCSVDYELSCHAGGAPFDQPLTVWVEHLYPGAGTHEPPPGALAITEVAP